MTDAQDGMVVSTTDPEAMEFRRYVIEWLMLNHPQDCPVCDEGGHCLLQDETVSGGHGIRRYPGPKRTYQDQDLGAVRAARDEPLHPLLALPPFLPGVCRLPGLRGHADRQPHLFRPLPATGPWRAPLPATSSTSAPPGCSPTSPPATRAGAGISSGARPCASTAPWAATSWAAPATGRWCAWKARLNEAVNGYFICDRGRYGFAYANHPERPRRATVAGREVPWAEAIQAAAPELGQISRKLRPRGRGLPGFAPAAASRPRDPQAVLPAPRAGETPISSGTLAKSARSGPRSPGWTRAWPSPCASWKRRISSWWPGPTRSTRPPCWPWPCARPSGRERRVAVLDPRPVSLPFEFEHLPVAPGRPRCRPWAPWSKTALTADQVPRVA